MFRGFTRTEHTIGLCLLAAILGGVVATQWLGRQPAPLLEPAIATAPAAPSEALPPAPATGRDGFVDGKIDVNTAPAEMLASALPGIGPVKAGAIVSYRETHGPFFSPSDLMKVRGIGEKTMASLAPLVTCGEFASNHAPGQAAAVPYAGNAAPLAPAPGGIAAPPPAQINVNTADAELLKELDGIGDVLAVRIIAERMQNGPFRSPDDLARVKGIGEKTIAKNRARLTVR